MLKQMNLWYENQTHQVSNVGWCSCRYYVYIQFHKGHSNGVCCPLPGHAVTFPPHPFSSSYKCNTMNTEAELFSSAV